MVDLLFNLLLWAAIGAAPGYYAFYIKNRNPIAGLIFGAPLGLIVGALLMFTSIFSGFNLPIVIILAVWVVGGLVISRGDFQDRISTRARINFLSYALVVPTMLIVLGIVIFPVIWNLIFSLRPIETGDLADVQLFDLSEVSLNNFESQMALRFDRVPCELGDDGACVLDEETGEIVYEDARRYVGSDYRGYREVATVPFTTSDESRVAVGVRNDEFYPMIFRTFTYTLTSTILAITFGLVAAMIVKDAFPGRTIFRGFILFPYIAPVISVAFVWQVLLRQNGLINEALGTNTSFLSTRDTFLGISIPLLMVILFQTWRYFPFAFLFILARIQAIPEDMYEAAKVDGATPSQRLFFITLPQLRAVFGTLFLLRFIWTFNKFDDVYLLTGPISQTKVIPVAIFEALFIESNVGQASAIAVVMAAILAGVLTIYFRYFLVEEA